MKNPAIPHVSWRDGRPRFSPSPKLRAEGHKGHDLKHPDGRWFTAGEALDWSNAFSARMKTERLARDMAEAAAAKAARRKRAPKPKPAPPPRAAAPVKPPEPVRSYPISQLWHDWLGSPRTVERLAERTIHNYRQCGRVLEDHDADLWASEVAALDPPICFGLHEALWQARGHATANNVLTALGIAIGWGIRAGKVRGLAGNPAHDLRKPQLPPRERFATREEIDTLIAAADELAMPEIGDSIMLGVWQGQRQGDRLAMRSPTMLASVKAIHQAKTGAIVAIPAAPLLRARLAAALERRKVAGIESDFVILDEAKWEPFTDASRYRKLFATVRTVAARKLPSCATLQDKDFRSTCVTWLALADCTIPQIASITGHTLESVHGILKHYLVLHPAMAASAIGKLIKWYESGGSSELAV